MKVAPVNFKVLAHILAVEVQPQGSEDLGSMVAYRPMMAPGGGTGTHGLDVGTAVLFNQIRNRDVLAFTLLRTYAGINLTVRQLNLLMEVDKTGEAANLGVKLGLRY